MVPLGEEVNFHFSGKKLRSGICFATHQTGLDTRSMTERSAYIGLETYLMILEYIYEDH